MKIFLIIFFIFIIPVASFCLWVLAKASSLAAYKEEQMEIEKKLHEQLEFERKLRNNGKK